MKRNRCILALAMFLIVICITGCTVFEKDGKKFETEYCINDYCQKSFIAEDEGTSYHGLLNLEGEVIVPFEYDNMSFINKTEYTIGKDDNVYVEATAMGIKTIFDSKGKKLITTDGDVRLVDNLLDGERKGRGIPFFIEEANKKCITYDCYGNVVYEVKKSAGDLRWISSDVCCIYTQGSLKTYKKNGKFIQEALVTVTDFGNYGNETYAFESSSYRKKYSPYSYNLIKIQENGRIIVESFHPSQIEKLIEESTVKDVVYRNELNSNEEAYSIIKKGNKWTIVDSDENLLHNRMYTDWQRLYIGENCTALFDENERVCIVGSNGNICVDFGTIIKKAGGVIYSR